MVFEYSWQQFRNLNHIRLLSESEQIRQYHFYLDSLANERYKQVKGPHSLTLQAVGFLLQEDYNLILQENNSGIFITAYA
jgi:hypothetical protein